MIPGRRGCPLTTLAYVHDPGVEELRSQLVRRETPVTDHTDAPQRARQHARMLLGIQNAAPTLVISGGGTAVWDAILTDLLDSYAQHPPRYNVVLYNPAEAQRRGALPFNTPVRLAGAQRTIARAHWRPLTFIGQVEAETHHALFPRLTWCSPGLAAGP